MNAEISEKTRVPPPDNIIPLGKAGTLPKSLNKGQQKLLTRIFADQIADGEERSADPYFTNDRGHNIGKDVALAAAMAAKQLFRLDEDPIDAVIAQLFSRLENAKRRFRELHLDPDGYGIATFGELKKNLDFFAAAQGIDIHSYRFELLMDTSDDTMIF